MINSRENGNLKKQMVFLDNAAFRLRGLKPNTTTTKFSSECFVSSTWLRMPTCIYFLMFFFGKMRVVVCMPLLENNSEGL